MYIQITFLYIVMKNVHSDDFLIHSKEKCTFRCTNVQLSYTQKWRINWFPSLNLILPFCKNEMLNTCMIKIKYCKCYLLDKAEFNLMYTWIFFNVQGSA